MTEHTILQFSHLFLCLGIWLANKSLYNLQQASETYAELLSNGISDCEVFCLILHLIEILKRKILNINYK